jgi:hypothetical protein
MNTRHSFINCPECAERLRGSPLEIVSARNHADSPPID